VPVGFKLVRTGFGTSGIITFSIAGSSTETSVVLISSFTTRGFSS